MICECMTQEDAINMSNEQAILILKPFMEAMRDQYGCPISDAYFALEKAINSLMESQWIACSERLPEPEKKIYWVCTDRGYQCQCRWTNINHFWTDLTTDWHWHIVDVPQYSKVIAWMEMPTPYMTADD